VGEDGAEKEALEDFLQITEDPTRVDQVKRWERDYRHSAALTQE